MPANCLRIHCLRGYFGRSLALELDPTVGVHLPLIASLAGSRWIHFRCEKSLCDRTESALLEDVLQGEWLQVWR